MHPAYQGSKKQARLAKAEADDSRTFDGELHTLASLCQMIESEAELDAILADVEDVEKRGEMRKLMLALREQAGPRIEIVSDIAGMQDVIRNPSQNRTVLLGGTGLVLKG